MPAGKPKRFESGEQMISLFADFCEDVVRSGYITAPTRTAFCKWLADNYQSTDRRTIYNSIHKYFPDIKKEFEQLQSDVIMQGGMLGKYNATMSIFGLKNWCGWGDNQSYRAEEKREDDALTKALKEEAEKMQNETD